jgi:DNA polymerase-3 subunit alpha
MMAYVTVEDDTGSIEMLAFSNVLSQFGGYLKENAPVDIVGRLSVRDDKDPQIVINRARPMSDYSDAQPEEVAPTRERPLSGKLYLKIPSEDSLEYKKVKAILTMFPGESTVVLYFADTAVRRGTRCLLRENMLQELEKLLGNGNVVVK